MKQLAALLHAAGVERFRMAALPRRADALRLSSPSLRSERAGTGDPLLTFAGVLVGAAVAWWGVRTQADAAPEERQASEKQARDEREAAEARERRVKGAALVGVAQGLLVDAEPARLALAEGERRGNLVEEFWGRWRTLRDETLVYACEHPSERVGEIAAELLSAVPSAISEAVYSAVIPKAAPQESAGAYRAARIANARAKNVAERLRAVVRGDAEPLAKTDEELGAEFNAL